MRLRPQATFDVKTTMGGEDWGRHDRRGGEDRRYERPHEERRRDRSRSRDRGDRDRPTVRHAEPGGRESRPQGVRLRPTKFDILPAGMTPEQAAAAFVSAIATGVVSEMAVYHLHA